MKRLAAFLLFSVMSSAAWGQPTNSDPASAKALWEGNQLFCKDCHGMNGEGTDEAPDLIGTRLSAGEIAAFLQKPDPDAQAKGMPNIPATSPDLKPLVAFVLSIKRPAQ